MGYRNSGSPSGNGKTSEILLDLKFLGPAIAAGIAIVIGLYVLVFIIL